MSWVAAITFTPLLGYLLFKPNAGGGGSVIRMRDVSSEPIGASW